MASKELYRSAYFTFRNSMMALRHVMAARVPAPWVPKSARLARCLTIGITTYEGRYDRYFQTLEKSIKAVFEDVHVVVAVNGSNDELVQKRYIERLVCNQRGAENIHFLVHSDVVGLARMWNEIVRHSRTPYVLLLNDDIDFDPWFRVRLEPNVLKEAGITTINGSWSHYILNVDCYEDVGPFDEGFTGIGFEDIDYGLRLHEAGWRVHNVACREIYDLADVPEETSYDYRSDRVWGKYTKCNEEHFLTKYRVLNQESDEEIPDNARFVKQLHSHVVPRYVGSGFSEPVDAVPFHKNAVRSGFSPMDNGAERILQQCGVSRRIA